MKQCNNKKTENNTVAKIIGGKHNGTHHNKERSCFANGSLCLDKKCWDHRADLSETEHISFETQTSPGRPANAPSGRPNKGKLN